MRIRDINDALNELGRVCMMLKPNKNDKPQTKLGVLNMAVEVRRHLRDTYTFALQIDKDRFRDANIFAASVNQIAR